MNPLYNDKVLFETYTDYRDHHPEKIDKAKIINRGRKHDFNIREIEEYTDAGSFFSVGCGNGIEIEMAKKRGWMCEGYEINPELAGHISKQYDIRVYSGDFKQLKLRKDYYECLYVNHVIEHTKNPGNYLRKIYDILKPGGILFIGTPNINGLANKVKGLADSLKLRKNKGNYYGSWQHLFYYTPASLKFLLEQYYSFEVILMNNDIKIKKNARKIHRNFLDRLCYRTSFRLLAKKEIL
jgi:SAM-dependent methyltransferase